jgi:hypothetical protein
MRINRGAIGSGNLLKHSTLPTFMKLFPPYILGILLALYVGLNPGYAATPIPRGLVAFYPLNATATDAGHNHYDGTVFGPTAAEDHDGNANGCFNFSAANDWIMLPIAASVFESDYTISVWLKMKDFDAEPQSGVLSILAGDQGCVRLQVEGAQAVYVPKKLAFYMFQPNPWTQVPGNEEGDVLRSVTALEADRWYFVCVIRNGAAFQMYIDGELSAEIISTRPITLSGSYLQLGNDFLEQQM